MHDAALTAENKTRRRTQHFMHLCTTYLSSTRNSAVSAAGAEKLPMRHSTLHPRHALP